MGRCSTLQQAKGLVACNRCSAAAFQGFWANNKMETFTLCTMWMKVTAEKDLWFAFHPKFELKTMETQFPQLWQPRTPVQSHVV